ncbi:MAG TPA: hypothetical protein DIW30_00860, partial [Bacteroidales bacterium]|nr:hypothetical protein [Bacteroidales bacterium]
NSLLKRHKRLFLVSVLFLVSRLLFLSLHQFSELREGKEKQMSALETKFDTGFKREGKEPSKVAEYKNKITLHTLWQDQRNK